MSSRDQILRDIRRSLPTDEPLPSLVGDWTRYADPHAQFIDVLRNAGGTGRMLTDPASLRQETKQIADSLQAKRICSVVPEAVAGNVDLTLIDNPHELADVDLAILPGELAVAENGAVWVTDRLIRQRVIYFLAQHVVLVVPAECIIHNMHEAYERLRGLEGAAGPFQQAAWGAFISGPSKTADIEQSLVIGAHGARSLHVFFTRN